MVTAINRIFCIFVNVNVLTKTKTKHEKRFFGLLATIMMCGSMLTGLTSCSNSDNFSIDNQNKVAVLLPDGNYIDRWITDKANLKDMANNTAMIINSLISNSPIHSSQSISNIPVIYSKLTVVTKDSY